MWANQSYENIALLDNVLKVSKEITSLFCVHQHIVAVTTTDVDLSFLKFKLLKFITGFHGFGSGVENEKHRIVSKPLLQYSICFKSLFLWCAFGKHTDSIGYRENSTF